MASYKRLGRYAPARAILLPNAPADLKSWLSDRLGAIEWIKVEESARPKEAAPQPSPTGAPRARRYAGIAPDLAATYRLAFEALAPRSAHLAPVIPDVERWRPPPPRRRAPLYVVALEAAE